MTAFSDSFVTVKTCLVTCMLAQLGSGTGWKGNTDYCLH